MSSRLAEEKESLWSLALAPLIWAVHFMASYLTAAVFCAKLGGTDGPLRPAQLAIAGYTVGAVALLAVRAARGLRRSRDARGPREGDSPEGRHAFLGYMELLLSLLSLVAVVFSALPAIFITTCR
jgi:hypothetical protein